MMMKKVRTVHRRLQQLLFPHRCLVLLLDSVHNAADLGIQATLELRDSFAHADHLGIVGLVRLS